MNLLISICARGGSKGIPGKNIRKLGGKHLIGYTIESAHKFTAAIDGNVHIGLSTDSPAIRKVAELYGLRTAYVRPTELGGDNVGKLEVLRHLLAYEEKRINLRYDYLLDLDITSPLRTTEDLKNAFRILQDNREAMNIFSVNRAGRNPYFNMVELNAQGFAELCKKPEKALLSRQSSPDVYSLNASFYFFRRAFFDADYQSHIGAKSLIYEVPHICFDLDEPADFDYMQFLLEQGKLEFEL